MVQYSRQFFFSNGTDKDISIEYELTITTVQGAFGDHMFSEKSTKEKPFALIVIRLHVPCAHYASYLYRVTAI